MGQFFPLLRQELRRVKEIDPHEEDVLTEPRSFKRSPLQDNEGALVLPAHQVLPWLIQRL